MSNQVGVFPNNVLAQGDQEKSLSALKEFNEKNGNAFIFVSDVAERHKFSLQLLELLETFVKSGNLSGVEVCLESLVVMSRDHRSMTGKFAAKDTWNLLVSLSGLGYEGKKGKIVLKPVLISHASKCLCNIIFLTKDSQGFCNETAILQGLVDRLKGYDPGAPSDDLECEFLSLRLLFLITVFNVEARTKIVEDYEGRRVLIDFLAGILKASKGKEGASSSAKRTLTRDQAKSCSEILKTLFNINIKVHNEESRVREEKIVLEFSDITNVCRQCALLQVENDEMATDKLLSDAGNCMYSIPSSCFCEDKFIPELNPESEEAGDQSDHSSDKVLAFEGRDVSAVSEIVDSVEKKIKNNQLSTESLQPVLSLLSHLSRNSRIIRRFCKQRIIPPRKEFKRRPEVGLEFKNKLIKLFTNANTEVKAAAADFVFVLCKEKVDRLVKYTGYGNSAGLLASRGLLAGGRGDTIYSDTDSDSDTEEYKENADRINPVTGHIPPDLPNPMEGMSDEQKEYIAMQLANQLTKLSDANVFQPVCVDEKSGKLVSLQQKFHETELPEEKDSDDSD